VLVPDLGFLGDTVHLFPALWTIRQAYPEAKLHVIVAAHITSLMECVPWVDCVWGYSRFPKHASLAENIRAVRRLRREKFDVAINLNGSDRSSWLTFLSGAKERLGRVPMDGGPWLWQSMFTEVVEYPFFQEPAYQQKWRCLQKAGFPGEDPGFHIEISPKRLQEAGFSPADLGTYFHFSPFSTADRKELPPDVTAKLVDALQEQFPEQKLVLSCAGNEREKKKMEELLKRVKQRPWRVEAGSLSLIQLTAVIHQSALHLSGDTGPLHLAMMTGAPTVSWFRAAEGLVQWIPKGPQHRNLIAPSANEQGLEGVSVAEVLKAAREVAR
jgi:ADP-heptose:LPS heptosyltransferase